MMIGILVAVLSKILGKYLSSQLSVAHNDWWKRRLELFERLDKRRFPFRGSMGHSRHFYIFSIKLLKNSLSFILDLFDWIARFF